MASGGKIEIEVELEGAGKVEKKLNGLKRGAEVAGGQFTAAGDALSSSSNVMTQSLGGVISTVGALTSGLSGLTGASRAAGGGMVAMLGPIAAIGTAVVAVALAVRSYIETTNDMETRLEAMKAAAAEYTAQMEALSDENIKLTKTEHRRLLQLTTASKVDTEFIQKIREGEGVLGRRIVLIRKEVATAQAAVDRKRKMFTIESAYQEQSRKERQALRRATLKLQSAEEELIPTIERAADARRKMAQFVEEIKVARGRTAIEQRAAEALKLETEAAKQLTQVQQLQISYYLESEQTGRHSTQALIMVERQRFLARKKQIQELSVATDEQTIAILAAEAARDAKIGQIRRRAGAQRRAKRAQDQAAREAADRREFLDAQKLEEAKIRLRETGTKRQRQLLDLRLQTVERLSTTETQRETARLEHQRQTLDIDRQIAQEQAKREAEALASLERRLAVTMQLADETVALSHVDMGKLTAASENFGQALVQSSLAALQSGESMKAAVAEALKAIALQAGVEAVMETARGTALLFTPGGQLAAAGRFKAAAIFGLAASLAGGAGAALAGSSGGGGGGGGGGTSPTGRAQSANRGANESDSLAPVTINVNLQQAVIYDTREAALRAFGDDVNRAMRTPRRGAARRGNA